MTPTFTTMTERQKAQIAHADRVHASAEGLLQALIAAGVTDHSAFLDAAKPFAFAAAGALDIHATSFAVVFLAKVNKHLGTEN